MNMDTLPVPEAAEVLLDAAWLGPNWRRKQRVSAEVLAQPQPSSPAPNSVLGTQGTGGLC